MIRLPIDLKPVYLRFIPKTIAAIPIPTIKKAKGVFWLCIMSGSRLKKVKGSINKGNPIFKEYQHIFKKLSFAIPEATAQQGATGGVIKPIIAK